jgi:tRNA(adenine34) deaminase
MCSYCIREAWIGRVVYALSSPVMGGFSKWNILRDEQMSDRMPQVFAAAPEVVSGVLARDAQQAWRDWSPLAWEMIKLRGLLTDPCVADEHVHAHPAHPRSFWHYLQLLFERTKQAPVVAPAPDAQENSHL